MAGQSVASRRKTIEKMRQNPRGWRIEDLRVIATRAGADVDHDGTSHVVFRHPGAGRISAPASRPIKAVYVRLFLEFIDRVERSG